METKKNPRKDVNRLNSLWFNAGLFISLCVVIMAFEWKSYDDIVRIDTLYQSHSDMFDPPVTFPDPPKPRPKPVVINPVEMKNDEPVKMPEEWILDLPSIGEIDPPEVPEPPIEKAEEPPLGSWQVEKMPEPDGGYQAFYNFISKNIRYPAQARRIGVEGKVYVEFVVDKEGNITDTKIMRGIGAGCDEEVLRLMKIAPKWNPGKQRGRPVRVRMLIPVNFQLSK